MWSFCLANEGINLDLVVCLCLALAQLGIVTSAPEENAFRSLGMRVPVAFPVSGWEV